MRLLLAEDEEDLSRALVTVLKHNNYSVDAVYDGAEALDYLENGDNYDGVILDIMMPKMDGITVLKTIRRHGNSVPVLLLTAKAEIDDRVEGLDSGADDYVAKPFGIMELISRIKAVLRRCGHEGTVSDDCVYNIGCITLNTKKHSVEVDGNSVELTLKEFEVLRLLMKNQGTVITRDILLEQIWGYDFDGETRTVDVHIRTLRQKLGHGGNIIKTIRGVGYRAEE